MRTIPPIFRQSQVAAALALALAPAASMAATIFVNSTGTAGPGTLHDAILAANSNCFSDPTPLIAFNFVGTGPFVIQPSSPLPNFNCTSGAFNPTVDGYTQTDASPNTLAAGWDATLKVVLDGSSINFGACGIAQSNSFGYGGKLTVKGLRIQNFSYGGDAAGACERVFPIGNEFINNDYGVYLSDYGFAVGSSGAADRNVFVGNGTGIFSQAGGLIVENNFIGTPNGTSAQGNGTGIYVGYDGGLISGNVISGNLGAGIEVYNDYGGLEIRDNVIGLTAAKTAKLANGGGGILVGDSDGTQIHDNFVSGNSVAGIAVQYSSGVTIENNTIGLNYGGGVIANTRGIDASCGGGLSINGNTVAGNQFEGVLLSGVSSSDIQNNTIADNGGTGLRLDLGSCYGGNNFVYGNLVTGNNVDGILLTGATVGNHLTGNYTFGNSRKNINLNSTSTLLPNDPGDSDGGANNQQNHPVLDSVTQSGGNTDIDFTLNTTDGTYNIEFYANDTAGGPAAQDFIGSTSVTVYGGVATGSFNASGLANNVSATATGIGGNTSELSLQKAATTAPAVSLTPSALVFGNQRVGTSSMDRIVTVRSLGDQPYVISSFCYGGLDAITGKLAVAPISALCTGGAFTCESTCVPGQPYNKNQTCQIKASFSPGSTGSFSEDLFLCDNSSSGVTTLNLSGTGVPPPPLQITPTFYDFGGIPVGGTSETATFEVRNVSYGMLQMMGVSTTGEFDLVSTTCSGFIYGGGTCEAVVSFGPTISGESFGTVTAVAGLAGDAAKGAVAPFTLYEATADLVGVGLAGGEMTLPGPIELGAAPVGGAAITRTVELRNTGLQPVNVASITVSAPFVLVSNTCVGTPIPAGGGCSLVIGFTATAVGSASGSLTIVSDATGGSGVVSVHATGQLSTAPLVVATPTSIGFGDRTIGTQTSGRTVSITNIGGATANLSLAVSSIDFILGGTSCGATLAPLASCIADVAFRPILGFGPRTGALVINSNSSNSPLSVILGGTSCRPFIGLGSRTGTSSNCAP